MKGLVGAALEGFWLGIMAVFLCILGVHWFLKVVDAPYAEERAAIEAEKDRINEEISKVQTIYEDDYVKIEYGRINEASYKGYKDSYRLELDITNKSKLKLSLSPTNSHLNGESFEATDHDLEMFGYEKYDDFKGEYGGYEAIDFKGVSKADIQSIDFQVVIKDEEGNLSKTTDTISLTIEQIKDIESRVKELREEKNSLKSY